MKVAVQCESPLLQRSLEIFLGSYLSSLKQCDVVVRDKSVSDDSHPTLLIGTGSDADLLKPFSYSQLMLALDKMHPGIKHVPESSPVYSGEKDRNDEKISERFILLQARIEILTREYQKKIMEAVREFHEG